MKAKNKTKKKVMTHKQLSRLGGLATKEKMPKDHFKKLAKLRWKKYYQTQEKKVTE